MVLYISRILDFWPKTWAKRCGLYTSLYGIYKLIFVICGRPCGFMVSVPDSGGSSPIFRALAGDIVLCSWARHFTLMVPLSTQVYKWVLANCWRKPYKLRGSDLRWTSIPSRGSRNTSSRFMLQKRGKLRLLWASRLQGFPLFVTSPLCSMVGMRQESSRRFDVSSGHYYMKWTNG